VIVDRLDDGTITTRLFQEEQSSGTMLQILGYNEPKVPVIEKKPVAVNIPVTV
jgi:hypothetical protein